MVLLTSVPAFAIVELAAASPWAAAIVVSHDLCVRVRELSFGKTGVEMRK